LPESDDRSDRVLQRLAQEMGLEYSQVTVVAGLLGEGNTVPFIARYRKEASGGMNDEQLRLFEERLTLYGNLEKRRADILRLLEEQGVLTPELEGAAQSAASVTDLEDIYRPYRPKKRTRATVAREQGLEPLAQAIVKGEGDLQGLSRAFISEEKGILSEDQALAGARDIIAEMISDDARVRRALRRFMSRQGYIATRALQPSESPYEMYYDFREPVSRIAPHRVLAVNRGEKEEVLSVRVEVREDQALDLANRFYLKEGIHPAAREQLMEAVRDSWKRLLFPSLERELRNELTENAEEQALKVFKDNLRNLLMSPPVKGRRVLGVDPGYRTGCKLACVDQHSKLLDTAVIYPTPPRKEREPSAKVVADLVERHQINAVAIGNGTAGRETEEFFAEVIGDTVEYTVVNEAGASVYSASPLAKEEFPDLDVAQRSAVSIARRLQDPLAELVKIDPKSIGVGQYQHDVNQGRLGQVLDGVVEACVNEVGVDLNTASPALLERVAGINRPVASNIVAFRNERGGFRSRLELREVPKLGPRTFQQCAGFLRLPDAEYYFDRSAVHPESYGVAERVMEALGISGEDLGRVLSLQGVDIQGLASRLGVGEPTLRDILAEMGKPGRDPRDDLPKPVFKKGIVKLEDLKEGMELQGIVSSTDA
jgi:uncharacterized protein